MRDTGQEPAFLVPIREKYPNVDLTAVYPGFTNDEIDALLTEEWSRTHTYEAFTQHRERPQTGKYINIAEEGFRRSGAAWPPWPPAEERFNIFVLGGSTTFGVGVADSQSIVAHLEGLLRKSLSPSVSIYNFGRGYYYSSQERSLFEKLLLDGFIPDAVIFIDGLNDLGMRQPPFSDRLKKFMDGKIPPTSNTRNELSILRAARGLKTRLFQSRQAPLPHQETETDPGQDGWPQAALDRYLTNNRMIRAVAKQFGVSPVFVWQPVPFYKYDWSNHLFSASPVMEEVKRGYELFANLTRTLPYDRNFIWLADMQENLEEPLYVDAVHYTDKFARLIAEEIDRHIGERGLLSVQQGR